jgi:hypothetical protein
MALLKPRKRRFLPERIKRKFLPKEVSDRIGYKKESND